MASLCHYNKQNCFLKSIEADMSLCNDFEEVKPGKVGYFAGSREGYRKN